MSIIYFPTEEFQLALHVAIVDLSRRFIAMIFIGM